MLLAVVGRWRRRRARRPRGVAVVGHFVAVVLRLRSSSAFFFETLCRAVAASSALCVSLSSQHQAVLFLGARFRAATARSACQRSNRGTNTAPDQPGGDRVLARGPRRLAALRSSLSLSAGLRFSGALQRPRRVVPMNERPAYRVVGATNSNPSLASSAQLLSRVTQRPKYTHGRDGTHAEGISPVPRSQRAGGQPSRRAPPPNNQAQGSAVEARQPHHQPTKRYHDA